MSVSHRVPGLSPPELSLQDREGELSKNLRAVASSDSTVDAFPSAIVKVKLLRCLDPRTQPLDPRSCDLPCPLMPPESASVQLSMLARSAISDISPMFHLV